MDEILQQEAKRREIVDRVYRMFLKEADAVPENQWRVLALGCINRILQGVECSLRTQLTGDALMQELGYARCTHCEALLAPAEIDGHQCKKEDLERLRPQANPRRPPGLSDKDVKFLAGSD